MRGKLSVISKVYRKPTHTQQYIHWNSNHPKNVMLGVLKGLIHRAHVLCDRTEDLLEELELLKNGFISNGKQEKIMLKVNGIRAKMRSQPLPGNKLVVNKLET